MYFEDQDSSRVLLTNESKDDLSFVSRMSFREVPGGTEQDNHFLDADFTRPNDQFVKVRISITFLINTTTHLPLDGHPTMVKCSLDCGACSIVHH